MTYYGFEVIEEFGLEGDGKGSSADQGLKLRLCSAHADEVRIFCIVAAIYLVLSRLRCHVRLRCGPRKPFIHLTLSRCLSSALVSQRDNWVESIQRAARPTWIDNSHPDAKVCMSCQKKFGLTTRKSHCRRCGCVMCKKCTTIMLLPQLLYDDPQKCCITCEVRLPSSHCWGKYTSHRMDDSPFAGF
eukprot:SAG11_NODE_3243_length_2587_cov_2.299035_1_plen_187_part_00